MAFDTSLLDEALRRRRAERERERRALLAHTLKLLQEMGPRYNIRHAYIFGSITRPGCFTEDSDIDIAVEAPDPKYLCEAMSVFAAALGREVDMFDLNKCHFAHHIREEGVEWKSPLCSS